MSLEVDRDAPRVLSALRDGGKVLLTGPVGPDGDSIGACLALQRVLEAEGIEVVVAGVPPARYAWLPGADRMVPDDQLPDAFGAVAVLDGDRHRLTPEVERRFARAPIKAIVDHHGSTRADGYTHAWIEPSAESTCGMLLRAFRAWEVPLDRELAEQLYVGLVFDTGGFRHSNTTPETHRLAAELLQVGIDHAAISARILAERRPAAVRAMGAVLSEARWAFDGRLAIGAVPLALQRSLALAEGDLEGVVDVLIHAVGTDVAALLVERPGGQVKYSLRSRGDIDVAQVAHQLAVTGGGHPRAAGAVVDATIDEAAERVCDVLAGLMSTE
jgi:bifunctional oligoribonuclease and PAP phosphatase NrnA